MNTFNTDLAHRMKSGDSTAFEVFYAEQRPWVFRKALRLLRNYEDAEEATNDVFIQLWNNIDKWNPRKSKITTWFSVLCHRKILDIRIRLNRKKHYHGELESDESRATLDYAPDTQLKHPLDLLIVEEGIQTIEDILCGMSSRSRMYRMSWILVNFEGYSYRETARILNIEKGVVSTYVGRCRRIIVSKLNQLDA